MTDLEISKALALAIGWQRADFMLNTDALFVLRNGAWHLFDYRDWNVIGPIAERYNAFPVVAACNADQWVSQFLGDGKLSYTDTPQKAIALAVIEGAGK